MLPAVRRDGPVVVGEAHSGAGAAAQHRVKGEPGHCKWRERGKTKGAKFVTVCRFEMVDMGMWVCTWKEKTAADLPFYCGLFLGSDMQKICLFYAGSKSGTRSDLLEKLAIR